MAFEWECPECGTSWLVKLDADTIAMVDSCPECPNDEWSEK